MDSVNVPDPNQSSDTDVVKGPGQAAVRELGRDDG